MDSSDSTKKPEWSNKKVVLIVTELLTNHGQLNTNKISHLTGIPHRTLDGCLYNNPQLFEIAGSNHQPIWQLANPDLPEEITTETKDELEAYFLSLDTGKQNA